MHPNLIVTLFAPAAAAPPIESMSKMGTDGRTNGKLNSRSRMRMNAVRWHEFSGIFSKSLHFSIIVKWGWMQCDDRIQIPKQVGPIVWNALSSAKSGFILRYSRYHQQPPIMHSINWKYCPDFTILSTFCLLWVKTAKVGSLVTILVLHDHWPSLWSNVLLLYPFIEIVCIWSETCCATK